MLEQTLEREVRTRNLVKTYSTAAVSLSCRMKSPLFPLGLGVDILDIFLEGSAPLSGLRLRSRFANKRLKGSDIVMS
jgi:Zn-dependent M16 (insulinase) family peptidase